MKTKVTRLILVILLVFNFTQMNAQNLEFEWVSQIGGNNVDLGHFTAVDNSGNIYTIGTFRDTAFTNSNNPLISEGVNDVYIQKLDPNGNLIWINTFGGINSESGISIAIDNSGYLYATGSFKDTVDFDSGNGITNLISHGINDVFILKLDLDGNFNWVKQMGGSGNDQGGHITLDEFGNIYTTGHFEQTVDFNPGSGTANYTSNGEKDIFLQKLDSIGNYIWTKQIGGNLDDLGTSINLDDLGNIYLSSIFHDTVDFNPGVGVSSLISHGNYDIAIQKLNSNGDFQWVKHLGGNEQDNLQSFTMDSSGNIYLVGSFKDTVDFDPGNGTTNLQSNGDWDIFVQKLNSNGDLSWIKQIGGLSQERGEYIAIDSDENIYITGSFIGSVDFDPNTGLNYVYSSAGGNSFDTFILKLDNNGNFIWVKKMDGDYLDSGEHILVDINNNVIVTGYFEETTDFNPSIDTYNLVSEGNRDAFILKLSQCEPTSLNFDLTVLPDLVEECIIDTPVFPTANNSCHTFTGTTSTVFPITTLGTTVVTWTYNDGNGNSISQNQNVIISGDTTSPVPDSITLPNLTGICEILNPNLPTGTDNCSGNITATTTVNFPITDQSITEIIWTYDDGNGNTYTQNQSIIWTPIDQSTNLDNLTITANHSNATYQWLNCNNNYSLIPGETNQSYTAINNGNYAVEITENGCVDTTDCVLITGIGIQELMNKITVYPNPTSNSVQISFGGVLNQINLTLTDIQGNILVENDLYKISQTQLELLDLHPGIYILSISSEKGKSTFEIIKN